MKFEMRNQFNGELDKDLFFRWTNPLGEPPKLQVFQKNKEFGYDEPYLTVNFPYMAPMGFLAIKDYSENEGLLETMIKLGIVISIDKLIQLTHVEIPVCRIDYVELGKYIEY